MMFHSLLTGMQLGVLLGGVVAWWFGDAIWVMFSLQIIGLIMIADLSYAMRDIVKRMETLQGLQQQP